MPRSFGGAKRKMENNTKLIVSGVAFIVGVVILLIINPFVSIDATERGLKFTWGALDNVVLEPGMHWRTPIMQKVKTVTVQPIQLDHDVEVGSDGAITKDNQTIGAQLTVFYKYKSDDLVRMWRDFGTDKTESIILTTLRESFKAVVGEYDIFKLPTVQDEIRNKTFTAVKEKMAGYPVEITELKVVNYDWSDDFDVQIKTTMERAQQVKQKEQELLITEQEAQKKVKEAEADKQAMITRAEGEKEQKKLQADARALEGDGIKKYNEAVATNWDIELQKIRLEIERIKAEKWNGQYVPNNMYGPIPVDTAGGVQGR